MKKIKTSLTIDLLLYREFTAQVKRHGLTYYGCVEMLMRNWLESIEKGAKVPSKADLKAGDLPKIKPRNKRHHKLLEVILESKTPGARDAIMKNLRYFAYTTSVAGPKSDKELDRDLDILIENQEREEGDE